MASHRHSDSKHSHEMEETQQELFWADAPRFEKVYWTREPHLRKLYTMAIVLMVASATTGYDGMLVNTSQLIMAWQHFFADVNQDPNKLGILVNMFSIGSIVSFFITPFVADHYGRKPAIVIGCIFMISGGCLTAFATSWESMSCCFAMDRD
jgi:MFS family permease